MEVITMPASLPLFLALKEPPTTVVITLQGPEARPPLVWAHVIDVGTWSPGYEIEDLQPLPMDPAADVVEVKALRRAPRAPITLAVAKIKPPTG